MESFVSRLTYTIYIQEDLLYSGELLSGFIEQGTGFDPGSIHVKFV